MIILKIFLKLKLDSLMKTGFFLLISLFLTPRLFAQNAGTTIETYLADHKINPKKIKDGLYMSVETEGKGAPAKLGNYLKINYVGKLLSEKIFDLSPKNEPFVFRLGYRQVISGWETAIATLKIGSKVTLFMNPNWGYGSTGADETVPPNAPLIFEIELLEAMSDVDYDKYMKLMDSKARADFEVKQIQQFVQDKKLIAEYAAAKKLKINHLPSGLSYIITKNGKGTLSKAGDEIAVHYEGSFLDGTVFDATKGKKPFQFVLGFKKTIAGWEEGLKYFNKGSEGILLIPSKLGYGATPLDDGKTVVPSNSVLVFKIQLMDIAKSK
jgi:FKBP-type peptidyl-prolyl cis-trans isomerase